MFYRDYMQKFRPAYAPDGVGDGAAPAAGTTPAAAPAASDAAAAPAALDASAAAAPVSADGPAVADVPIAADAAAAAAESTPSLIEQASGKPNKDGEAAPASDAAVTDPKKDEPAPAEAAKPEAEGDKPPAEGDKAAEATDPDTKDATAEEPPAPIKYEAFKMPDGVKLDDERIGKFAEIAGPAQVPQEIAQKLLDLHVEEIQRVGEEAIANARAEQRKAWNTYVDTITTELRKDSELGGNRLETSLSMAKAVIEEYLPANEAAEYLGLLRHNGMGNHRLQVKLLHRIGEVLNIFEDGMVPANPQAPKAQKGPGNRGWYTNTPGNAAS